MIDDLTAEEADAFWTAINDGDTRQPPPYRRNDMTAHDPQHSRRERPRPMTREEHLANGRLIRPLEEMAIDDLTDEEWDAFWTAINEA